MTGFRATGKGLGNRFPDVPANADNASAVMTDAKSGARLYLYVTNLSTSWSLQGSASQTQARRTFYPQHLVQGQVIFKGQCPNQYEYDRIVEFVEKHHHNMLGLRSTAGGRIFGSGISSGAFQNTGGANQNLGDVGVSIMLLPGTPEQRWIDPPQGKRDIAADPDWGQDRRGERPSPHLVPKFFSSGVITEVRAGAQRFNHAPEFELAMKVTHDHISNLYQDARSVKDAMSWFHAGLGEAYEPGKQPTGAPTAPTDSGDASNAEAIAHAEAVIIDSAQWLADLW